MNTVLQLLQFIQQHKTLVSLVCGGVLGVLLGLAIGWWWWPIELINATPGQLRSDFQNNYILWVAEQYATSDDVDWARGRLGVEFWEEGQLAETLEGLAQERSDQEATHLRDLAEALESAPAPPEQPADDGAGGVRTVAMVCGAGALALAVVAGAWFLVSRLRKPSEEPEIAGRGVGVTGEVLPSQRASWKGEGTPLTQYLTTYTLGDDHYDPSFSIELESGEFMGECGVGISETIGVGAPDKVAAFEIWLFDKNDIRTVTTVVMSEYAFHDEALRTKLAPKGEPLLADAGKDLTLETKMLRVRARIVEAEYGVGDMPPSSFFEKLTVDLAAWAKPGQEGARPTAETDAPVTPPTL
jgi:hypothetical protein